MAKKKEVKVKAKAGVGVWLPCGCRKDSATGKLVRTCPEHQKK